MWIEGGPGGEELLAITESAAEVGARISLYRPDGRLVAAGPFVGELGRWRHLLAAGPFGPNGEVEIAATRAPHLSGEIEFYKPDPEAGTLEIAATLPGYATHTIYSRDLDRARAGDLDCAWELLVPKKSLTELVAVRRTGSGAEGAVGRDAGDQPRVGDGRLGPHPPVAASRSDGFLRVRR